MAARHFQSPSVPCWWPGRWRVTIEPLPRRLHALLPLYIWALVLYCELLAFGDFVLGESTPRAAMSRSRAERAAIFRSIRDSDRSACQSSRGQAASSGIAVLSPALFTLVTPQHLALTPGMCPTGSAVARGSGQRGYRRRQTLGLLCHSSPLTVSGVFDHVCGGGVCLSPSHVFFFNIIMISLKLVVLGGCLIRFILVLLLLSSSFRVGRCHISFKKIIFQRSASTNGTYSSNIYHPKPCEFIRSVGPEDVRCLVNVLL